jgi:hypothetical protein
MKLKKKTSSLIPLGENGGDIANNSSVTIEIVHPFSREVSIFKHSPIFLIKDIPKRLINSIYKF